MERRGRVQGLSGGDGEKGEGRGTVRRGWREGGGARGCREGMESRGRAGDCQAAQPPGRSPGPNHSPDYTSG